MREILFSKPLECGCIVSVVGNVIVNERGDFVPTHVSISYCYDHNSAKKFYD